MIEEPEEDGRVSNSYPGYERYQALKYVTPHLGAAEMRFSVEGSLCLRMGGEGQSPGSHMASCSHPQIPKIPKIPNSPNPHAQIP